MLVTAEGKKELQVGVKSGLNKDKRLRCCISCPLLQEIRQRVV